MTPKEKAKELVEKMKAEIPFTAEPSAVQCALIAVDEVIKCSSDGYGVTIFSKQYWQEVKQEIEAL